MCTPLAACLPESLDSTLRQLGPGSLSNGKRITMNTVCKPAGGTSPAPAKSPQTCDPSEDQTYHQLTLFAAGHLANPLALPGSEQARQMTATSGRKCLDSFERLTHAPAPLFLRMCLEASIYFSPLFYLTWNLRGIPGTTRWFFLLQHSARPTSESESSLCPTPTNSDDRQRKPGNPHITSNGTIRHVNQDGDQSFMRLSQVVKLWPTVQSRDYRHGDSITSTRAKRKQEQGWSLNLNDAVLPWATPQARDWKSGKVSDSTMSKNRRPLNEQITSVENGELNPDWVETLMGFPPGWSLPAGPPLWDRHNTTGNPPEQPIPPAHPTESTGFAHWVTLSPLSRLIP